MKFHYKGNGVFSCNQCLVDWVGGCPVCKKKDGKGFEGCTFRKINSLRIESKSERIVPNKKEEPVKLRAARMYPVQPMPITIDNFFITTYGTFEELQDIPDGFIKFYSSKGSTYYTNESKTQLVRVSDHWGYWVAFCDWHLNGYPKMKCKTWVASFKKVKHIGIINFSDLNPKNTEQFKVVIQGVYNDQKRARDHTAYLHDQTINQ